MVLSKPSLDSMGLRLGSDPFNCGYVGAMAGTKQHRGGRDCPVQELLLARLPGGHDHRASSRAAIVRVVLGSLQSNNIPDEGGQGSAGVNTGCVCWTACKNIRIKDLVVFSPLMKSSSFELAIMSSCSSGCSEVTDIFAL